MGQDACPRCWEPLVVRDVSPCFDCGAWEANPREDTRFTRYRLPSGDELVLCTSCYYEGICSGQSQVPELLGVTELDLVPVGEVKMRPGAVDKYCERCRLRLALLKLVKA